jgi:hypothetical protein
MGRGNLSASLASHRSSVRSLMQYRWQTGFAGSRGPSSSVSGRLIPAELSNSLSMKMSRQGGTGMRITFEGHGWSTVVFAAALILPFLLNSPTFICWPTLGAGGTPVFWAGGTPVFCTGGDPSLRPAGDQYVLLYGPWPIRITLPSLSNRVRARRTPTNCYDRTMSASSLGCIS